jgi:hypothetical protein
MYVDGDSSSATGISTTDYRAAGPALFPGLSFPATSQYPVPPLVRAAMRCEPRRLPYIRMRIHVGLRPPLSSAMVSDPAVTVFFTASTGTPAARYRR